MHVDLHPQQVYKDEYLAVEVDLKAKFISVDWTSTPCSEEFRKSFYKAASISLEQGCEYWISDARAIPFLYFADQNWVLRELTPMLKASSLKKFARISTPQSVGMMDIHRIYSEFTSQPELEAKTQFGTFTERAPAMEWLFSEPE